ncbi:MAG TPA: ABC transporter permease [Thermoflexales bacterium]|jgi:spermidine/putrescine transport system permease protein|nr:ABC transporter permease [Thermoflexales bacterium]HQX10503.1 ABC transporter permease [Thermoflexales bacterium]HQY25701.1 ABC transporter permease [Thermoflexales bacterium]HQZ53706.1 ABC transporter permease [Thermoflexales bacterium]HRA53372.1 ABC transporter permease [Thermoflexales bacterium]
MMRLLRQRKGLQLFGLMLPGGFWLIVFFLLPIAVIGAISLMGRDDLGSPTLPLTLDAYIEAFDPIYLELFLFSLWLSFLTTIATLVIAMPVALFITRLPKKWRNTMVFLVMIPFWTNFLVRTYALLFLMRANGPINNALMDLKLIAEPLSMLSTPMAVWIGLVYGNLPFMILPLYSSLEKFDWTLIEAAQDLGANTSKAFFRVMLPLTAPGLLAGSILTFVPAVGSYITVELMGGGKTTMIGRVIATQFGTAGNWPLGSAMSIVLMVIVTIAALLYFRAGRGERIAL